MIFDILAVLSFIIVVITAIRLDYRFSAKGIVKLIEDVKKHYQMSVIGKQGGYAKKKSKLNELMTDFALTEVAPDLVEGVIPGIPPFITKWIGSKLADSDLGDYLRENPEMAMEALQSIGPVIEQFQERQAAGALDRPASDKTKMKW